MKQTIFIILAAMLTFAGVKAQSVVECGAAKNDSEIIRGDIMATGTITGTSLNHSDYRRKKNIQSLSDTQHSLDMVMQMNPIEYNLINLQMGEDIYGNPVYMYEGDEAVYLQKHFGLIAQELREIFPNLVYEGGIGGDGYLSISYTELIPVLIRAIQELKAELDEAKTGGRIAEDDTPASAVALRGLKSELFQNTPNPFSEKTVIACTVAENVKKAVLYVYDMSGKQISQHPIVERGETAVTIEGGSLDAGMYLYSLIADGNVIDTKRMILTK